MCSNANADSLSSPIVFLRYVLSRFKTLNDRSALAVDTGIVSRTFSIVCMFGYNWFVASSVVGRSASFDKCLVLDVSLLSAIARLQFSSSASALDNDGSSGPYSS